jgi:hypothetical protein
MSSKVSGLLSQQLDRVLQSEMIAPGLNKSYPVLLLLITSINEAHVLMLERQQIISRETARRLASAILEIELLGPERFQLDPALEDAYFNYEAVPWSRRRRWNCWADASSFHRISSRELWILDDQSNRGRTPAAPRRKIWT